MTSARATTTSLTLTALLALLAGCTKDGDPPARPPPGEQLELPAARDAPRRRPPASPRPAPDRKAILALLNEASRLIELGRSMEKLRTKHVVKCVRMMRLHRPVARKLQSRLRDLPSHIQVPLATAVGSLDLCVSCSPSAPRFCHASQRGVRAAKQALGIGKSSR